MAAVKKKLWNPSEDYCRAKSLSTAVATVVIARRILARQTRNITHSKADVAAQRRAHGDAFGLLESVVENVDLERHLLCRPLDPLFKVR